MTASAQKASHDPAGEAVAALASMIGRDRAEAGLSAGDRAELRRMRAAEAPLPPIMWRLLTSNALRPFLEHGPPGERLDQRERALAALAQIMVEAGPQGGVPIGRALAQGYAEQRFIRLLRARGTAEIAFQAGQAARWCAQHVAGLAWNGFGRFILAAALDRKDVLNREDADRRGHAIARDYFAQLGAPQLGAPQLGAREDAQTETDHA